MYGLIGQMNAAPGKRDELIQLMLSGTPQMPGCLSYVIARDPQDENAIWITEVWDSEQSHEASLEIPEVRATIEKAMPLIAGFGQRTLTEPIGGVSL